MLDTIRSHVRSLARTLSGRLRLDRSLVLALLLVFLVGVGAASVTIHTLGLNPITGASNTAGDPVIIESQSLSITNGNADSTTLVLRHPSEHRVACAITGTLRNQQGGIVDQTATETVRLSADETVSTTLDFPLNPATSEYLIFETATTGCEMLGWPMFGFNPARMGTSTRLISAIAGPQTLDEQWGFQSPNAAPMAASPALANGTVYVGSVDDSLYALDATNGSKHWSYPTGGDVNSTAAVVGGTVYVGSNNGTVAALDAADGTQRWANNSFGPVASSPAVVDGTVYVGSDDGSVYALDATDGSGVWSYATAGPVRSSPAVVNGTVYVGSDDGTLSALDAADGSVVWTDSSVGAVGSSPAVVNGTVYVGSDDGSVYAFDASDGSELWNYSTAGTVRSSPAIVNGTVYVGSDDGTLYALGSRSGTVEWSYDTGSQVRSSPAVVNETVYVGNDDGTVYAMNASTGVSLNSFNAGDSIRSGPVVYNNTVYVSSTDGYTYALEAASGGDKVWLMFGYDGSNARSWNGEAPTGTVLESWNVSTGGAVTAAPVVANKTVYVGSRDGTFYALSESGGTTEWTSSIGKVRSAAAVDGSTVIAGSDDGSVYALDSADGSTVWTFGTGGPVRSPVTVGSGTAYVGSDDDSLYALDTADGSKRWSYGTGGDVRSAPAVVDGSVYAGSANGKIYALDAPTGQRQWIHRSATGISGAPTVVNGTVFVGSTQSQMPLVKVTSMTTTKQWRKGEFNGTSAQGPNGTRSDELWMGYDNGTSSDSLAGYYRMDGPAGTATDYSGNSNDGTTYGAIRSGATGTFGTDAYDFDGNDDLVNLSQPADLDITSDMTVVTWVNADTLTTNNDRIVAKDPSQYVLRANTDSNPKWEFAAGGVTATAPTAATTGNWTMVAGRYDDSTGNVELWIDGKNVSMGSGASISSSGTDAYIGYFPKSGGGLSETFFDGQIDEVQIYDRKLSKTEMRDLYRYGGDGTYTGNYSRPVTNSQEQIWKTATVNVSTLPATDVTLDAEFVAKNTSGTIIDRQSLSLTEGTNQMDLSVANSENAELRINGTTTNVTKSWWVQNASFTSEASDPSQGLVVEELSDWNQGTYDATSADGNATRSGQLSMGYMNGSATDDLHGYWRFDGTPAGSGGTFTDYSSFDNTGTTTNNVDTDRAGVFSSGAVNVSRTNKSYVNMGNSDSVDITGNYMTVSAWIKFGPQQSSRDPIISKGVAQWEIDTTPNKYIRFYGETGGIQATSNIVPNQSKWYHVVARYDANRGMEAQLWVNGTKVAEDGATGITSSGENLTIGREPGTTNYASATVDEVRIYDTALSNASIGRLYRDGKDGTFTGNYTHSIETKNEQEWQTFRANVTDLPPAASVDATIEARNSSGVVDSQTVTLTGGTNTKSLSLAPTSNLGVYVNGSTTDVGQSWRIDNFSVDRGQTPPPQTTALDYNNEWSRGTFDGTTSDAATLATAGTLSMRYGNGTAGDSLQGFYRFDDDASANTTRDYSGNDIDGSTAGGITTGATGTFNSTAFDFDGTDDEVDLGNPDALNLSSDMTISAWVNSDTTDTSADTIVAKGDTQYGLRINANDEWEFYVHDGSGTVAVSTGSLLTTDTWVHLVGRYDAASDEVQLCVDGTSQGTATATSVNANGYNVSIGNNTEVSGANFDGKVDEVRIYNRSLSTGEIDELYRYGGDGTYEGNYSHSVDTDRIHSWTQLTANVTGLPPSATVNATVEARRDGGTVVATQTVQLTAGETSHSLSLNDTNDARIVVNGTTTAVTETWAIENLTLERDASPSLPGGSTAPSGPSTVLDTQSEWDGGTYDRTSSHGATASDAGILSMRYLNGTGSDDLHGYYRLDRDVSGGNELTISSATDWNQGAFNGTTSDGADGTVNDRLTLSYANGTTGDSRHGYWRLDRAVSGSGGTVLDYSGEGNDGTTYNSVTTGDAGVLGTDGIGVDNTDAYVEVNDSANLSVSGDFALSVWVKTTTFGTSEHSNNQTAIVTKPNYNDKKGFALIDDGDYTSGVVWRVMGGGKKYDIRVASSKVNDGNWHQLVGVYDSGTTRLYLNGTQVSSNSSASFDSSTVDMGIGADRGGGRSMGSGNLDEIQLYNRSLTDSEVRELYRWGGDATYQGNYSRTYAGENPGQWSSLEVDVGALPTATSADVTVEAIDSTGAVVDSSTHSLTGTGTQSFSLALADATDTRIEINGTSTNVTKSFAIEGVSLTSGTGNSGTVVDYSGDGNDATMRDGATTNVTGVFGSPAYEFNGTAGYVDLGQPSTLNFTNAATISAWVKLNQTDAANGTAVAKGGSQYRLLKNDADEWVFATDDGTRHAVATTNGATPGAWVHLVGRVDPSASNPVSLWVNGSKVGATSGGMTANTHDVTIGRENETGGDYFDGSIDEVRMYDRALSDAEIGDLYRHGSDGTYDGNYSKVVETSTDQEWDRLVTNVTGLPPSTAVEATVEARQTDGTVLDSQTITLSAGQTSHDLSLPESSEARITVNGTTTAPTETWAVENATLVNTSAASETGPLPSAAEVAAVNASTGVVDWGLGLGTGVTTSPALAGDTVYVGLHNGTLLALDANTGSQRWKYSAGNDPLHASPAVVNDTVYFGGNSSVVYAVNATDGTQRWTLPTNGPVRSAPAPINGTVYVGGDDTGVRAAR